MKKHIQPHKYDFAPMAMCNILVTIHKTRAQLKIKQKPMNQLQKREQLVIL
jgi:hypothetical protein